MTELKILELSPSHAFGLKKEESNVPNWTIIDEYALEHTDLASYHVMLVTDFVDQEYLLEQKSIIEQFLEQGKSIVFCGHLFRKWLPGCSPMMPKRMDSFKDYEVKVAPNSHLFEGVKMEDMVYNKGVAGFFARGYYQPPKHAEICLTFLDGKVITYIDRETTNGTIIVHAGRSLFGYKNQKKTTDRISEQIMEILQHEFVVVQEG